ncbi:MAG TPA: circularly permuted type 2 ATP-grasp protein [Acidimicrobiales bacterium]|nr:circularly permuted type 2 ATP-grasp protein [Acidimicrobiales bacterium]
MSPLGYDPGPGYDELLEPSGRPRPAAAGLWQHLSSLTPDALAARQQAADDEIRRIGVTFHAADGADDRERPWPFDVIPRIIEAAEWARIRKGLVQRLRALNAFIDDVYHDQRSIRDGVVPGEVVTSSPNFRPECIGACPPGGIWAHICGSDLVRGEDGTFYVLEDNLRVPSGVSYLLENRMVAKRVFPELFRTYSVEPVDPYTAELGRALRSLAPHRPDPTVVILTPGVHNAAYCEHAFLAQQLGVELVTGPDLMVCDEGVFMRTVGGLERVDVIYRRVDDGFLDPEVFRRESLIGVPGLMRAWRAGNVGLVSAPGAGVADDKAVYAFVPDIIRYFLGEDPVLANVPTWRCGDDEDRAYVLDHLEALVIKPATESGGYGVVIGPTAGDAALTHVAQRISQYAPNWVAQPVLSLSTMPTLCDGQVEARHVDLRPFTVLGADNAYVAPGGLTRVARHRGSLIVNSSQGGGSKDTWVVDATIPPPPNRPPGFSGPEGARAASGPAAPQ